MKNLSSAFAALLLMAGTTAPHAQSDVTCAQVRADEAWQATGVDVLPGERVCIVARGLWSHGPEAGGITPFHGPRGYIAKPDSIAACYTEPAKPESQPIVPWCFARTGALLGKIATRAAPQPHAFPIEDELCFVAGDSGELLLSMNDVPGTFGDNQGSLRVRITTARTGGRFSDGDWPAPSKTDGRCLK
jgi:hypothetical protein